MFGGPNDFYDLGLQGTRTAFEYPSYINTIDSNVAFDSADDENDDIEFPRLPSTAFKMVKQEGPIMDSFYQELSNLKFDDFEDSEYSSSSDNIDVDTEQSNDQNGAIGTLQLLQQNIPSHLLLVSLLEHICFLYDSNQSKSKELFKVLCQQLTATKLLPKFAVIEEFQPIRERYRSTLTELMEFAVHTVKQQEGMRKLSFEKSLNWRQSKITNQSYFNANLKSPLIQTPSRYLEEFEEIDTLGKGGFGSVYHVRNKLDGKRYAVKKIDLAFVKPDDCFKVLREVKVLANLDHPNIVRYYSAWLEYAFTDKNHQKKFPARYQEQRSLSRFQRQFSSTTDDSARFQHDDSSSSSDVIFFKTGSDTDFKEAEFTDLSISNKLSYNKEDHLTTSPQQDCKKCLQIQGHRSLIRGRFSDWPIPSRGNALFGNPQNNKVVFRRSLSSGNIDILNDDVRTTKPLMNKLLANNPGQFDFKTLQLTMHIQMGLCSSTLKHWLSDRNNSIATHGDIIDWNINMKVFKQLLEGVHYIHCFGLMHRDLKPRNIFINRNCDSEDINVKIGDFGLARSDVFSSVERSNCKTANFSFANRDMSDEHATKGIGTVIYAAPEQLEKHLYTAKADIYSLGIILFELFAPFTTEMERLLLIRNLRQGKLPAFVKEKWPEESTFIIQMTEFQPDLRPDAAIILKAQFFEDKDKIIVKLRADLLERTKQINELKELLSKKEIEIKHLQQNAEKS